MKIKADYTNAPSWKVLTVKATLPEELMCLDEIAHNMWCLQVGILSGYQIGGVLDPESKHIGSLLGCNPLHAD